MKYYIIQKCFCLKILIFMFLANFIFVVSHLKVFLAVHLILRKLWRDCSQKEKFNESLLDFVILMF